MKFRNVLLFVLFLFYFHFNNSVRQMKKKCFVALFDDFWISYFISLQLQLLFNFCFPLYSFWNRTEHQKCETFAKANSAALFSD